jgi:hypothetical protein
MFISGMRTLHYPRRTPTSTRSRVVDTSIALTSHPGSDSKLHGRGTDGDEIAAEVALTLT